MKKGQTTTPEATEILASLNEIRNYSKISAIASKGMLTVEDLGVYTGMTVKYIYQLTSKRQIPFYKPNGKVIYFRRSEIDDWMMRNRQDTTEEVEQEAQKRLAKMDRKKK